MTDQLSFFKILAFFGTFMKITQTRLCSRNKSCFLIGLEVGIPGNSLNFTGLGSFLPANGLTPLNLPANGLTPQNLPANGLGTPPWPPSYRGFAVFGFRGVLFFGFRFQGVLFGGFRF